MLKISTVYAITSFQEATLVQTGNEHNHAYCELQIMKPRITNNCQKSYRINAKHLVEKIIGKIPQKFLVGLEEVFLLDLGREDYPTCRYVPSNKKSESSKIEIYMNNKILQGIPFLSNLALNIFLLLAINKHIDKHLKPKTQDPEILSINKSKINYSWMYLGLWNPFLAVFKLFHYFVAQRRPFRSLMKWWTDSLNKKEQKD